MKRITITVPDDLAQRIEREAKRRSCSVSEVARTAFKAELGISDGPRKIGFASLFSSGEADTASRIDELLAETWADDIEKDSGLAGGR